MSEPNPGQAFLDVPHEEGVMYNTELFEVMWNSYLAEWYNNAFKLRWKHKLLLAELNICTTYLNHMDFITSLCNMPDLMTQATPVSGKGHWRNINQLKPFAVLSSFACLLRASSMQGFVDQSHWWERLPRSSAFVSKMMVEVLHSKLMDLMLCPQRKKNMPLSIGLTKPLRRTLTASMWCQWIQKQMTSSRQSVMA